VKNAHSEFDANAPLTEQASYWWILLNEGGATVADRQAFGEWVGRSPERIEAFLQTAWLTKGLESKKTRWPDTPIEAVIREAKSASVEVVSLSRQPNGDRNRNQDGQILCASNAEAPVPRLAKRYVAQASPWPRIAVAVTLALVLASAAFYLFLQPERFQTLLGEQRSVVLKDGSVITLNTSSAIEVRMTKDHRVIKLISGEALFQVAHDATRPFDVTAGDTTVRAVGTQFNVNRGTAGTIVTVVEGKVAVSAPPASSDQGKQKDLPLAAGEQLTVAARTVSRPTRANVAAATAWTQRRLVFKDRPLSEVAAEFNRYNYRAIEIQSPELRAQEVTGVFQANDPESFMTFISRIPDVVVERSADNMRLVVRQEPQSRSSQ